MTEKKRSALMNFLFPKITLGYCVRLICVAAIAYGFLRISLQTGHRQRSQHGTSLS